MKYLYLDSKINSPDYAHKVTLKQYFRGLLLEQCDDSTVLFMQHLLFTTDLCQYLWMSVTRGNTEQRGNRESELRYNILTFIRHTWQPVCRADAQKNVVI